MAPQKRARWQIFRDGEGPVAGPGPWGYVALFVACMALGYWSVERFNGIIIWPANGVLIAAVLLLRRRQALMVVAACFAINVAGNFIRHDPAHMVLINALLNIGEALACATLARRFCGATLDLRRPVRLARFAMVVTACVAVSALIGVPAKMLPADEFFYNLGYWFSIETLGILVTTPTLLLWSRAHAFADDVQRSTTEKALLVGTLVVVTACVFALKAAPLEFLAFLPLLVIAFRLPPHWSAISVIIVASISSLFSLSEIGPFTLSVMAPQHWSNPATLPVLNVLPPLHLYLIAALAISFGASTVLSERRRLERQLQRRTETAQRARAVAEAAEQRVTHLSQHDAETGLLNRAGLENAASEMLELRQGQGVFVAALRIERFSAIRTAIGSEQAATLIAHAASRLENMLRRAAVARLSADSLGIALRANSIEEAAGQLDRARSTFAEPLSVGASRVDIRFSIGIAGAPEHADNARSLVDRAFVGLDQARLAGAEVAVFDAAAERAAAGGLSLLSDLRTDLETGAVWLAHQPKLDLKSGAWSGVESLFRWTHVARGPMPPDQVIPLLEETGLISEVTEWVLERALRDQAMLLRAGMKLAFAINVSARSLSEPGFTDRLTAICERLGITSGITLEITETALMADANVALANLEAARAAGFRISIDDYGAGMSSLSYLKRIPADELKIDASFVRGVAQGGADAVLVRSTIDLAHSLGLSVVAEGVEDESTLETLRSMGCDYAQGYHIARPMPVERLLDCQRSDARVVA